MKAPAEVQHCAAVLAEATAAHDNAVIAEQYAVAERLAEGSLGLSADADKAILDTAGEAIAGALRDLLTATGERNAALAREAAAAREAGLIVGSCDPLSPVSVRSANGRDLLTVAGVELGYFQPGTAARAAFQRALVAAGIDGVTVTA